MQNRKFIVAEFMDIADMVYVKEYKNTNVFHCRKRQQNKGGTI